MLRSLSLVLTVAVLGAIVADAQLMDGDRSTEFTVRIENVSTPSTLKLSNGETAPAPTAPVLWVIHTNRNPLFIKDRPDRGHGLEHLAEDGDPSMLAEYLKTARGVVDVGAVAVPIGDSEPGPILPGKAYELKFRAEPGQQLTLAMMFGQSNDWFYAPSGDGINLFDEDEFPITGDITSQLVLWDAGTEVDEEPGLGPNQAPRQKGPNTGEDENGTVRPVGHTYDHPSVGQVLRVSLKVSRAATIP